MEGGAGDDFLECFQCAYIFVYMASSSNSSSQQQHLTFGLSLLVDVLRFVFFPVAEPKQSENGFNKTDLCVMRIQSRYKLLHFKQIEIH